MNLETPPLRRSLVSACPWLAGTALEMPPPKHDPLANCNCRVSAESIGHANYSTGRQIKKVYSWQICQHVVLMVSQSGITFVVSRFLARLVE
jgi:hypothetical protein